MQMSPWLDLAEAALYVGLSESLLKRLGGAALSGVGIGVQTYGKKSSGSSGVNDLLSNPGKLPPNPLKLPGG